jgi:hypothetical protein
VALAWYEVDIRGFMAAIEDGWLLDDKNGEAEMKEQSLDG